QQAIRRHQEVSASVVTDAGGRQGEQEKAVHPLGIETLRQSDEIGLYAVDPDAVGVVDQEGLLAELRQSLLHAASGIQKLLPLVGYQDAGALAGLQMRDDLVGEVMHVDDRLGNSCFGDAVEGVV